MKITSLIYSFHVVVASFFQQAENSEPALVGDILEPDPIPFTFETIGWKILGVVLVLIAIFGFYKWLKLYKKNAYRREALKQISLVEVGSLTSQEQLNQLNIILKQVAILAFGREQVAELFGENWLLFLDSKNKKSEFIKYVTSFEDAIYSNKEIDNITLQSIYKTTKSWINGHS